MVPLASRRQQSPPRAVGARGPELLASPVAGGCVEEICATGPRDALGHPEDRRHFLPETLARRHAWRLSDEGHGRHGPRVPEESAGELSGSIAKHHAAVGG